MGIMKNELDGQIMTRSFPWKPKMVLLLRYQKFEKMVIKQEIKFEHYKNFLEKNSIKITAKAEKQIPKCLLNGLIKL